MSKRRAFWWFVVTAAAVALYLVSCWVTGEHTQNGAWALLMLVVLLQLVDHARVIGKAMRERGVKTSDGN